jgi:hypothetical protein
MKYVQCPWPCGCQVGPNDPLNQTDCGMPDSTPVATSVPDALFFGAFTDCHKVSVLGNIGLLALVEPSIHLPFF